jgi:hypothetical protein
MSRQRTKGKEITGHSDLQSTQVMQSDIKAHKVGSLRLKCRDCLDENQRVIDRQIRNHINS